MKFNYSKMLILVISGKSDNIHLLCIFCFSKCSKIYMYSLKLYLWVMSYYNDHKTKTKDLEIISKDDDDDDDDILHLSACQGDSL